MSVLESLRASQSADDTVIFGHASSTDNLQNLSAEIQEAYDRAMARDPGFSSAPAPMESSEVLPAAIVAEVLRGTADSADDEVRLVADVMRELGMITGLQSQWVPSRVTGSSRVI